MLIEDKQELLSKLEEYFKSYGYTIDNPNIILNPYKISPLTALIIFETKEDLAKKKEEIISLASSNGINKEIIDTISTYFNEFINEDFYILKFYIAC